MTASFLGATTIGGAVPMAVTAQAQLEAAIGASLPNVQAQLAGALQAQTQLIANPPTPASALASAQAIVAALTAGTPVPVSTQLECLAAAIAQIEGKVSALQALASWATSFLSLMNAGGINLFSFAGAAGQFGPEMGALLSGATAQHAITLITPDAAAWTAMQSMFRTNP